MADPAIPSDAAALLNAQGLRPRKSWGQNFLCDRNVLSRIVAAAELSPDDRVVEIGPGLGALTRALADTGARVSAVEIDRLLEPILAETLAGREIVRLVFADFLKLDLTQLLDDAFGDEPGVVVANIPYNITTPIIERLLAQKSRIRRIVLLVQQEFAARMAAAPGRSEYGAMSIFAQYHASVEIVAKVPRTVFVPAPEVGSAVIRLTPAHPGAVPVRDEGAFFRLVRASFQQRRKTLLAALAGGQVGLDRPAATALLARAGIDSARRGETLSLSEFARLADSLDASKLDTEGAGEL